MTERKNIINIKGMIVERWLRESEAIEYTEKDIYNIKSHLIN